MILPSGLHGAPLGSFGQAAGLTPEQDQMLRELWQARGLDATAPLTVQQDKEVIGPVSAPVVTIDRTGDGITSSKLQRR